MFNETQLALPQFDQANAFSWPMIFISPSAVSSIICCLCVLIHSFTLVPDLSKLYHKQLAPFLLLVHCLIKISIFFYIIVPHFPRVFCWQNGSETSWVTESLSGHVVCDPSQVARWISQKQGGQTHCFISTNATSWQTTCLELKKRSS